MKDILPELKYSKSACGVEFMLNVADSSERPTDSSFPPMEKQ